ncbi:MAG TPA: hypothetical protein VFQ82_13145, partial [Stellaceae bacterium]|nr:hypothetical protein [Stellaceae bacterium]
MQRNYPLQFGRPFLDGAITGEPQVLINGAPVASQADVKNRYPDGSVEFAVIAVVIPTLPASGSLTLTFQNGPVGSHTPLTTAQMLDMSYNFNAQIMLKPAAGTSKTASGRTMLQNGNYQLWTAGPVAQTIMLADDGATRKYDLGFDGYRPFRPRFYATFWPATHQVAVRYVGENDNTQEIEDLSYGLTLIVGNMKGYGRAGLTHYAFSNWTERFWLGGTPAAQVNIDFNLAYLAATHFLPNYDPAAMPTASALANEYALWTGKPHDLYDGIWDGGLWETVMSSPGERQEVGPYPTYSVMWAYSGDWRMRQMALGMADLAAAFPGNLREGAAGKRLLRSDPAGSSTGLGRAVSLTDRRTLVAHQWTYAYTAPGDAVKIVGPVSTSGFWTFDDAHQPQPFFIPYLLTGDPWYLDEMYLWAGFTAGFTNGAATGYPYGRGPTGAEGGEADELRAAGWLLRSRAEAAFIAPDSDPEKAYFTTLTNDALARWEGGLGLTGTALDGSAEKVWGAAMGNNYSGNNGPVSYKPPVLHGWESNGY